MRRGSTSTSAGVTIFPLFLNDTAPTEIYTLPLHAALPISRFACLLGPGTTGITVTMGQEPWVPAARSEEHTAELQSHHDPVCRLLLETKGRRRGDGGVSSLCRGVAHRSTRVGTE